MADLILSVLGTKGGVGKTTIARLTANGLAIAGWRTKVYDLDRSTHSQTAWHSTRLQNGFDLLFQVEQVKTVEQAVKDAAHYDAAVIDGFAKASQTAAETGKVSDGILLPTGVSDDELFPAIVLANTLVREQGVSARRIRFVVNRTGDSHQEVNDARRRIEEAGYTAFYRSIQYKTGYRSAANLGKTPLETSHPSLNKKAQDLVDEIGEWIGEILSEKEAA